MNNNLPGFVGGDYNERLRQILQGGYPHLLGQGVAQSAPVAPPKFIINHLPTNRFIHIVSFSDDIPQEPTQTTWGNESDEAQAFLEESEGLAEKIAQLLVAYGTRRFALELGMNNALDEIRSILPSDVSYEGEFKTARPQIEKALLIETAESIAGVLNCAAKMSLPVSASTPNSVLEQFLTRYAEKTIK